MRANEYEYGRLDEYTEVPEERKEELIKILKAEIEKNTILLHKIFDIGEYDEEYEFIYKWLEDNKIQIQGINMSIVPQILSYSSVEKGEYSEEQLKNIFSKIHNGDEEARKNFIEKNIMLAKEVTSFPEIKKLKIPKEDSEQIAMLGLIRAVDKYNAETAQDFSEFALQVIYRKIISEWYKIEPESIIRSENKEEINNEKLQALERLAQQYRRNRKKISMVEAKIPKVEKNKTLIDDTLVEQLKSITVVDDDYEIKEIDEKGETKELLQELKDTNDELLRVTLEIEREETKKEKMEEEIYSEQQEK